jgi:hypothetical protein
VTDRLRAELLSRLPEGHEQAVRAGPLARALGVTPRALQGLIGELIEAGHLVGSSCTPGRAGYFLIPDGDLDSLEEGTRHLRSRALGMLARYSTIRRMALERHGPEAARLFDLGGDAA